MKRAFVLFSFLFVVIFTIQATICTNTVSGNWSTTSIWSCGHVPTCGDTVIIKASTTVSMTAHSNYYTGCASCATAACNTTCTAKMFIVVNGKWWFSNGGGKISLPCCSKIFISTTGTLDPQGNGSSSTIDICNSQVWRAADGAVGSGGCFPTPCSSLPVELIAFVGNLEVKTVFLNWKTISESTNNYFEVEKSSDGANYSKIATVKSKAPGGNYNGLLSYDLIDNDLKHPLYYYRLHQVDLNGVGKHSNSISVKIYSPELKIYPNPNTGQFWIDVPTAQLNQQVDVKIYDNLAQPILDKSVIVHNDNITGAKVEIVPSQPLPKGIYFAVIKFQGSEFRIKLVVN